MSTAASSSTTAEKPAKIAEPLREDDAQPTLGVLEEDDEFEEFAVAGTYITPIEGLDGLLICFVFLKQ